MIQSHNSKNQGTDLTQRDEEPHYTHPHSTKAENKLSIEFEFEPQDRLTETLSD